MNKQKKKTPKYALEIKISFKTKKQYVDFFATKVEANNTFFYQRTDKEERENHKATVKEMVTEPIDMATGKGFGFFGQKQFKGAKFIIINRGKNIKIHPKWA